MKKITYIIIIIVIIITIYLINIKNNQNEEEIINTQIIEEPKEVHKEPIKIIKIHITYFVLKFI